MRDLTSLTPAQRSIRANIRNFLLTATPQELAQELELSERMSDVFRAECVLELIGEIAPDASTDADSKCTVEAARAEGCMLELFHAASGAWHVYRAIEDTDDFDRARRIVSEGGGGAWHPAGLYRITHDGSVLLAPPDRAAQVSRQSQADAAAGVLESCRDAWGLLTRSADSLAKLSMAHGGSHPDHPAIGDAIAVRIGSLSRLRNELEHEIADLGLLAYALRAQVNRPA